MTNKVDDRKLCCGFICSGCCGHTNNAVTVIFFVAHEMKLSLALFLLALFTLSLYVPAKKNNTKPLEDV